jgi:hypothetical protein
MFNIVEVRLEDIVEERGVLDLFQKLGLKPTTKTFDLIGQSFNSKSSAKKSRRLPNANITVEECYQHITNYLNRCHDQGLDVPSLPQMQTQTQVNQNHENENV